MLPILHAVQASFGCVSPAAEAAIAGALNLSRAEVHGVVSFYPDFHEKRDTRRRIQICRAEACQARGVEALVSQVEAAACGADADGRVALETVYCLGLCGAGPCARVGDTLHARLNAAALIGLIEAESAA